MVDDLRAYIEQLANFKLSTTVQEFMDSIEQAQQSSERSELCTVNLHLVGGWLTKTMDDLEKLVNEIFKNKTHVLSHLKIVRGSVIVTYSALRSEADYLITLALERLSFITKVGVHELAVGETIVVMNDTTSFDFESSLLRALEDNDINLLSFLLNINTNPDTAYKSGETALFYASHFKRYKAAFLLLKANANPNLQRSDGTTPLSVASYLGHTDIVALLVKADANPNLQRKDGATSLFFASQNGHTAIVSLLLKSNADPNLQTNVGTTPLYIASGKGQTGAVILLLKANANPNLQANNGATPLSVASQNGHTEIVTLLLEANANSNLKMNTGTTPLMASALNCHSQIVQLLLTNGADPNLCDLNGSSALMYACHAGNLESVELLLMSGADPNIKPHGPATLTSLDMAADRGHEDIVDFLQAIKLSQSSSTTSVFTASEIASNADNETMALLNRIKEQMLVEKTESRITAEYQKLIKKTLPSKQNQKEPHNLF